MSCKNPASKESIHGLFKIDEKICINLNAADFLAKYFQEVCLLNQKYIKDEDRTIEELIKETAKRIEVE